MKYFLTLFLCVFFVGCTQINFNDRYLGKKWSKVILAPTSGSYSLVLGEVLEHELATATNIEVITPVMLPFLLTEYNLVEAFKQNRTKAIFQLAKALNAQGVILSSAEGVEATRKEFYATVQLTAQLIDVESKAVVMSSKHDDSSIFSDVKQLIIFNSNNIVSDLKETIIKLNVDD